MEKGEHSHVDSGSRVWGRTWWGRWKCGIGSGRWWQGVFFRVLRQVVVPTQRKKGEVMVMTQEWRKGGDGGSSQAEGGEGGAGTDIEEWRG